MREAEARLNEKEELRGQKTSEYERIVGTNLEVKKAVRELKVEIAKECY